MNVVSQAVRLVLTSGPMLAIGYAAGSLLIGGLPVAAAWQTRTIMDAITRPGGGGSLAGVALMLAAISMVAAMVPPMVNLLAAELVRRVALVSHAKLYDAINSQPGLTRLESPSYLDKLELARQAGEMGPGRLFQTVVGLAQGVVTTVGFVIALTILSPLLAMVVFAAALPGLAAHVALGGRRASVAAWIAPVARRQGWLSALLTGASAIREIRLYDLGGHIRDRILSDRRALDRENRRLEVGELRVDGLLALMGTVVGGAGLVWAVTRAGSGALTVGDVFIVLAALAGLHGSLGSMAGHIGEAREATLLFRHYCTVVSDGPDLQVRGDAAPGPLRDGIELRDVWFRYAEDLPWVLRGVNLRFPAGAGCALVGVNGSGKSTIVKLLCRFYDPQRGSITWDGADLRDLDPRQLRARIAALSQDFVRYELDAYENIAFGDLTAADATTVGRAARRAGADEFISALPQGFQTPLTRFLTAGDATGVQLSGGQWQRIALARTLLRSHADLLILDEPSASLDAAAEAETHSRLKHFRAGCTRVLVSHRLGSVREADLIAVIDGGTVTELGTHDDLMASGGTYARLFRRQAGGYLGGNDDVACGCGGGDAGAVRRGPLVGA